MTDPACFLYAGQGSPAGEMQPPAGVTAGNGEMSEVARRAAHDVPHGEAALRATNSTVPPARPAARNQISWQLAVRLLPGRLTSDRGLLRGKSHDPATPLVTRPLDPTEWWGPFSFNSVLRHAGGLFPPAIGIWLILPALAQAEPLSLLDSLLANAPALSAALTNVAQNLGEVDGSFAVGIERDFAALADAQEIWSAGRIETAAALGVRVTELQENTLEHLTGLALNVNTVSTTAVGSLQAADMTGSFNAGTLTDRIEVATGPTYLAVETWGSVAGLVAMQNLSLNSGEVLASVNMQLADVEGRVGAISTTALGALQNGALQTTVDLSATVQGQMGEITASTTALLAALVGR